MKALLRSAAQRVARPAGRAARWLKGQAFALLLLIPLVLYLPAAVWLSLPSRFAVVMSESMEPAYAVGDLVILRPVRDIEVGDVVAFETPRGIAGFPPRLLHRVASVNPSTSTLITKGDANDDFDPFTVGTESVLGKATGLKVPYGGYAILFLQSRYGQVWIALIALICAYPSLARAGGWARHATQRAIAGSVGLEAAKLERVEHGVDQTRVALDQFSLAIAEYATHLRSHTAAVQALSDASRELKDAVRAQNEVLQALKETLAREDGDDAHHWYRPAA